MAIWYPQNFISSVLKNWLVQILLNSAQIQTLNADRGFGKSHFVKIALIRTGVLINTFSSEKIESSMS